MEIMEGGKESLWKETTLITKIAIREMFWEFKKEVG